MIIVSKKLNEKKNAGPKAPSDISKILSGKNIVIKDDRFLRYKTLLVYLFLRMSRDVVLIQHPIINNNQVYSLLNKNKTIILIHDISGLRNGNKKMLDKEIGIFKKFKYIIVHNKKMKVFLIENGVNENCLYILEMFDYLVNYYSEQQNKSNKKPLKVIYAGNLKKEKSPFIYQLDKKKMNFELGVYGLGIDKSYNGAYTYMGSFDPNDLTTLSGDFGLVWDGNYDESDEAMTFKAYTKYNNPHKLSCYIAAGLPVIVWEKSAVADFVKKNNIGYTVNSVYDINKLKFNDYKIKKKNILELRKKITNGYYTKTVINKCLSDMSKIKK